MYLRLNNKLVLEVQKLDISAWQTEDNSQSQDKKDTSMSADEILGWIKKFLFVTSYFEKLDIKNLVLVDKLQRSVYYDGKEYVINTPALIARLGVEDNNKVIELFIYQFDILQFGLQMQGKFSYQPLKKTLEMRIAISPQEQTNDPEQPTLFVHGVTDFHKINMEASSSHLYNLESIKPYILKLNNPILNDWLFKNVHYDVLKLHSLRFQSTLNKHFFPQLQKTLALDLAIESPKVYLAPHLKPIEATRVILYMRDEKLTFLLKEPFFTNMNLDGSEVTISNIFTQPPSVQVAIRSHNAVLNNELSNLLQIYNINVPLRSVDSVLDVNLDIDIQSKDKQLHTFVNGNIATPNTTLDIGGQKLIVDNFNLIFANAPNRAYVQLLNTKINYANDIQGILNILWNLQDSKLQGNLLIDKFALRSHNLSQAKALPQISKESDELTRRIIQAIYDESQKGLSEEILKIDKNNLKKVSIFGDLGQDKVITLPDFGVNIYIGEESVFELSDIAKIYPYSPILQYFGIPKGSLKLWTKDFETMRLSAEVNNLTYPLYDKNAQRLSHFFLEGVIDKRGIFIGSKNKKFMFVKEGNIVKVILDGYNLRIDEVFSSKIPALAQINQENEKKEILTPEQRRKQEEFIKAKQRYERENKLSPHIVYLETRNMDFYLKQYVIPSDVASVALRDGMIRADVTYGNGVANVDMAYSRAILRLSNFSATFLNRVWQRNIFRGGLFNFKGIYDDGTLKGEISMQNTIYQDLAIVQNVLALIDTIPALLTFRKPGLGANGYEIKNGKVNLLINDEYLVLENIHLVGSSIDVEGGGLVTLKNQALDIVLKASTLKTLTDIINTIPLLNYVILGSDGKITTGIVLKGTLDNPKSEVSVVEDILLSPFEMVGRILKPVDKLLNNLSNALDESVESIPPEMFDSSQSPQKLDTIE
ncbi:AsmA-like C-terminal domain-containing protein [Helicobacter sp. MIT 21-1697]|uniref:DUF3971 domain-containing protein n=1 Tax=Helicobacter sp. MIT 21-1697 TaxID=2993733 RepID=UPI00224B71C8|nr:DUF3971 domain-containing protein [Helicobacter sp. MIT 21-1697]MCX2717656.1 AsmA-like C-terminal domain-containing protein [Helicobacter sp. MIT 21-1697]